MGAPQPAGTPVATHSTTAPKELPALRAPSTSPSHRAAASASGQKKGLASIAASSNRSRSIASPQISVTYARIETSGTTSRAAAPPPAPGANAVFGIIGIIGMARPVGRGALAIIFRALVDIVDHQADRRAG